MDQPPANIKNAAILQLVSGLLTMTVMPCLSSFVLSMVGGLITGICTLGMFPIGSLCGIVSWLLIPVGIFELVAGIMGLANPQGAGQVMKIATFVEIGSILLGGLSTAIAGGVAMKLLGDPEVVAYIEG